MNNVDVTCRTYMYTMNNNSMLYNIYVCVNVLYYMYV